MNSSMNSEICPPETHAAKKKKKKRKQMQNATNARSKRILRGTYSLVESCQSCWGV